MAPKEGLTKLSWLFLMPKRLVFLTSTQWSPHVFLLWRPSQITPVYKTVWGGKWHHYMMQLHNSTASSLPLAYLYSPLLMTFPFIKCVLWGFFSWVVFFQLIKRVKSCTGIKSEELWPQDISEKHKPDFFPNASLFLLSLKHVFL